MEFMEMLSGQEDEDGHGPETVERLTASESFLSNIA